MLIKTLYLIICLGIFSLVLANEAAFVKKSKGDAFVLRDSKEFKISVGTKIFEKDTIITKSKSSVGLIFKDDTRISIGANSRFEIEEYLFEPENNKEAFVTNLAKGSIECITGLISKVNPEAFQMKAKTATMGIRGTHFIVRVD
ncbi:FecR family protein [Sulfurimonas sp.]